MLRYLIPLLLAVTVTAFAQDAAKPAAPPDYGWKHSLVTGLNLTQIAFTDWTQGGENALAYSLSADGKSVDDEESLNWSTSYRFAFGQTRLGNQGLRKTDDAIDLTTVYTYRLGVYVNPYAAATLKTQFAKGYMYDAAGNETEISKFFDPGFLTQSAGVGYQPVTEVKTRLGVGLREIVTSEFTQYANDAGTTDTKKISVDGGLESVTNVDWKLDDNLLFTTQLELFAPFKTMDKVVVRDLSSLTAKVNKYVTTMLSVQLINEPRISPLTQVKESISIGVTYTLF
jgi:hypothetical protein